MMSVLIVDDEVIIADGIAQMVQEAFDGRLAVYRAYSASEAQRIIMNKPVDILLTDIDMPEMSGLQLHAWVTQRWPLCKVLFLTGYSDFAYARQALEQRAFAYLLKSDGDRKTIDALERAIREVDEEASRLLKAPRLQPVQPDYIKQCVHQLLNAASLQEEQIPAWFRGWSVPISFEQPVFFAIGIVNGEDVTPGDAISVIESPAEGRMRCLVTEMNPCMVAILAQTTPLPDLMLFSGLLETAQRMLRTDKQADLTVLYAAEETPWVQLPAAYQRLLRAVERIYPSAGEHIAVAHDAQPEDACSAGGRDLKDIVHQIRECEVYLTAGKDALYFSEMRRVWKRVAASRDPEYAAAVYHTVLSSIESGSPRQAKARMDGTMDELAYQVLRAQRGKTASRRDTLIREVNQFIQAHLSEDISLTQIAAAVNFHPAYLSRIYKESTHMGLSEYIGAQRLSTACELLRETHLKVVDIGRRLGFNSATYFTRFFKKHQGVSPQEYRDRSRLG